MAIQTMPHETLSPSKVKNALLWVMQILGSLIFLNAGLNKLIGAPAMVGMYEAIGVGQWFRYLTGIIEFGSAILLLFPQLAGIGALFLMAVMTGAILTHLLIIGGSPALPIALLIMMFVIAYFRRDRTIEVIRRSKPSPI